MNMPRRTVKNFVRKSLSLGQNTVLKGLDVLALYQKMMRKTALRNVPESELYELALKIGFEIVEKALKDAEANNTQFAEILEKMKVAEDVKQNEVKTVSDMTDAELAELMKE